MKASVAVWVLLCCCMTETQGRGDLARQKDTSPEGSPDWTAKDPTPAGGVSSQQVTEPDIHTVLREMSVKIAQQEVELRCTKTQVEDMQTRLRDSESKAEAIETRLKASEIKAETMETRLRDSEIKAETMETRLRDSEIKVEAMETRIRDSENIIEEQGKTQEEQTAALAAVGDGLNLTGSQVEELRREREESRVSFSASLTSTGEVTIGPYSNNLPILVYKHVFSNTGNAYNPHTGIFTAPVRGVYHFVFFAWGNGLASTATAVSLHKNGEHIATAFAHQSSLQVTPSNGVSLLLEVGDVAYLKLWHNSWVSDNGNHLNTFSGHMLFQL